MKKNQLDEMQEQKLLQIEHNGCWIAFAGLLISLLVEVLFTDMDFKSYAAEAIVFFILDFYILCACLKNGIWDRRAKPNTKTNLLISLGSALVFGAIITLSAFFRFTPNLTIPAILLIFAITFIALFILIFLALSLFAADFRKTQKKLEEEPEEELKEEE